MEMLQEIHREWTDEVKLFFESTKDKKRNYNQLDGDATWALAAIEQKYKKIINDKLGLDFYRDVEEVEKGRYRKFSDLVIGNPYGFPELPEKK